MPKKSATSHHPLKKYWPYILLALIIAVAAFLRFYRLDTLPPGLHPDEAANGQDIVHRIFQGDHRALYDTNGPRESLFFYLQAIFVYLMGNTIHALRIAPAIIGTLGVAATYLWASSWFGRRVGLIAAFFMAVNPWAIIMSKDGFRASMTPLMVALTLWLMTKAYKTRSNLWFILSGASLGLGMYTYLSFRLFPLIIFAVLAFLYLFRRQVLKGLHRPILYAIAAYLVVLIPLGIFTIQDPGAVFARAGGTSVLNPELNNGNPIAALFDSTSKTLLMFNIHGDENFRHNLGGQPMLNVFVGIMFLLGVIISLIKIFRLKYFTLLAVFGVMLLPAILTAEGLPHGLRTVGAIPAVFILAALGTSYMLNRWYATFPINSAARSTGFSVMMILFALTAYQGYHQIFVAWARSPEIFEAYSHDAVAMAEYMNRQAKTKEDTKFYVFMDGYSSKIPDYLTHGKAEYTHFENSASVAEIDASKKPIVILVSRSYQRDTDPKIKEKFPNAKSSTVYSNYPTYNAPLFNVYEVK